MSTPHRQIQPGRRLKLDFNPYYHTVTHMKTTLDLPVDLLTSAKALAVRRRTTLRALVEHALRREIAPASQLEADTSDLFEVGPLGIHRLKNRGVTVTSDMVCQMIDNADEEDLRDVRDQKKS
ncbi:MAG: hypothetical protein H7Y36_12465 [Armatimonadetes bacterium]|nr:hypothetical protein [Akkermansiaceae bacterium]